MPKPQVLPAPLGPDATYEEHCAWMVKFMTDPTIKHPPPRLYYDLVQHEDGTVEFVRTPTCLALEAAFAEIFGPEPEDE